MLTIGIRSFLFFTYIFLTNQSACYGTFTCSSCCTDCKITDSCFSNYQYTCKQCQSGSYLQSSDCKACPEGCSTCVLDIFLSCSSCQKDYDLVGLACVAKPTLDPTHPDKNTTSSGPLSYTIQEPVSPTMIAAQVTLPIICTFIISYFIYRKVKACREQNSLKQQQPQIEIKVDSEGNIIKPHDSAQNPEKKRELEDCIICLHPFVNAVTSCKHSFHLKCILQWLNKRLKCPSCNCQLQPYLKLVCLMCKRQVDRSFEQISRSSSVDVELCNQCRMNIEGYR